MYLFMSVLRTWNEVLHLQEDGSVNSYKYCLKLLTMSGDYDTPNNISGYYYYRYTGDPKSNRTQRRSGLMDTKI